MGHMYYALQALGSKLLLIVIFTHLDAISEYIYQLILSLVMYNGTLHDLICDATIYDINQCICVFLAKVISLYEPI